MDLTEIKFITRLSGVRYEDEEPNLVTTGFFSSTDSAQEALMKNYSELNRSFGFDGFVIEEILVGKILSDHLNDHDSGRGVTSTKWFEIYADGALKEILK